MRCPLTDTDQIIVAWLQAAASRHTIWRDPEGDARLAAIAELRRLADGRADLLTWAAGLIRSYSTGEALYDHHKAAAALLVEAGADREQVERRTAGACQTTTAV